MAILNFSDVLRKVGLDPKDVKLIRHSLGDKAFKKCYDKNMVEEYTRVQSETFSNGYDYWCVFISDKSTTAKFFACYKVNGGVIDTQDTKPNDTSPGVPSKIKEIYKRKRDKAHDIQK